ncbi:MAG: serine/threonine-protein kinase, partial [Myxococcales bacterium]
RYAVESELGRGGMGVVYRALDANLGRQVALKVLEGAAGANPKLREYFLREARAIAQLVHPNIVTLFDAGLEGNSPYLVMELVDGEDLRTRLARPITLHELLTLLCGIARALEYAHGRRIVHRDVKPENILVSRDGTGKLMDFGVAYLGNERRDGRHATIIGTPAYMAPEQIKGEGLGGHTDVYALGVVMFECLTGQPPFAPDGALYHHVNTAPPDPRTLRSDIPPALAELVLQCLEKDPARRPARCTRCWRGGWPTSWARKTPWSSPWATPPTPALSPPSPDR